MVTNQIKLIDVVNLTVIEPLMVRQKKKKKKEIKTSECPLLCSGEFWRLDGPMDALPMESD